MTTAQAAARFLPGDSQGARMLFGLLGDAVQTPFWPLGTGANHAIYSAQMQALVLVGWKKWQFDETKTVWLADTLMKSMREEGGHYIKDGESAQKDYESQIKDNYKRLGCECCLPTCHRSDQLPSFQLER